MSPGGPQVTAEQVRDAGLALCRSAVLESGLPYRMDRVRLSDLTVDQGDDLSTALRALGVKESPPPKWWRDPTTGTLKPRA